MSYVQIFQELLLDHQVMCCNDNLVENIIELSQSTNFHIIIYCVIPQWKQNTERGMI